METPTHFSTVIVPHTLQDKKLSIPKEFVKKFGDELSDFATITIPDGRVWRNSTFHALIFDTSTFKISYPQNFVKHGVANLGGSSSKHELELPRTKCKMEEHMEVNVNIAHNGEDEHPTRRA
ncbi:hypothetical protein EZV62_022135 [Acer yangbiense]|uniref:Uncharacterized protein n=1 Tax=Acer yangbiense TaxID=1000413 RepID=A0A5C7H9V1_9ROSI|nr:hypothetical protein EZV62_022135 [Acer yangbiense]